MAPVLSFSFEGVDCTCNQGRRGFHQLMACGGCGISLQQMDGVQKTEVWSEVLDPLAKGGRTHKSVWTLAVVSSGSPPTTNSRLPNNNPERQLHPGC